MLQPRSTKHLLLLLTTLLALPLTHAAYLTFNLPSSPLLPNPASLPPSTHATLFRHNTTLTAPLTRYNTFDFRAVTPGSYLFTVQCRDLVFAPLRVDVAPAAGIPEVGAGVSSESVEVFQTFWGNEWGNKGERRARGVSKQGAGGVVVEVWPERVKDYYQERSGCTYTAESGRDDVAGETCANMMPTNSLNPPIP